MGKPLIGIGIVSYNRPETCTKLIKSIVENLHPEEFNYKIVCSLDQLDTTGYEEVGKLCSLLPHKNFGISINKSIALMNLQECDHVFLFEDDVFIAKNGWERMYLNMHAETGYQIFNYAPQYCAFKNQHKITCPEKKFKHGTIIYDCLHIAQITSITRKVMLNVGALDPTYLKYGYEHYDYTRRCAMLGYIPNGCYPFIKETWDYIGESGVDCTFGYDEKIAMATENHKKFLSGSKKILIPFTEILEIINKNV